MDINKVNIKTIILSKSTDNKMSYSTFEDVIKNFSLSEKYYVLEVLEENNIEIVDDDFESDNNDAEREADIYELSFDEELSDGIDDGEILDSDNKFTATEEEKSNTNIRLVGLIQHGDKQAKQELCIKNHGLVRSIAARYYSSKGNKIEFEDLVQVGMIGMLKAAEKFDLNMNTEFSTYATWWIRHAIIREINNNGFTIRIPTHKIKQIYSIKKLETKYLNESDYYLRIAKISEESGYTEETIEECLMLYDQLISTTSLDNPVGEDEEATVLDFVSEESNSSVENDVISQDLKELINGALDSLPDREKKVLRMRFGLYDGRRWTLEEIGKQFGVTRERARQIEASALRKIKHSPWKRRLIDYLY